MYRVAITGLTGFVGRHSVQALLNHGTQVRGLVRSRGKNTVAQHPCLELVEGTLEDPDALARLCEGVSVVVHCAGAIAAVGGQEFQRINVEGTRAVTAAARRAGASRMVHISSLAAREPQLSAYAASKEQSERVAREESVGMMLDIVRPPAVYGPWDRATLPLIAALTRSLVFLPGSARSRLSLMHVSDLASAVAAFAHEAGIEAGTYELSDGHEGGYSLSDLASLASEITGRRNRVFHIPQWVLMPPALMSEALAKFTHSPRLLTTGKLKELYHSDWVSRGKRLEQVSTWRPRVKFKEGFSNTLKWYADHGWLAWTGRPGGPNQRKSGAAHS